MDLAITNVPAWISILFFIAFSTVPIYLITRVIKKTYADNNLEGGTNISRFVSISYWTFLLIVALVSLTGFFTINVLPPRIIVLTALPLVLFYFLIVQRKSWFKIIFEKIKIEQLVSIHFFRFVGLFFFLTYAYGAIPKEFAYIGGTGDILTALLAIPVIIALRKKTSYALTITWVWNIIGLIDIGSVLVSAIILTKAAVDNNDPGVQQFGTFPFSWIPAFAPATIIFLHVLIFKKLLKSSS